MGWFQKIAFPKATEAAKMVESGAKVLDVRTPQEFRGGHLKGSINIPLDQIVAKLAKIESWDSKVVTVCRSGARSAQAADFLKSRGIDALNGGAWDSLEKSLHS